MSAASINDALSIVVDNSSSLQYLQSGSLSTWVSSCSCIKKLKLRSIESVASDARVVARHAGPAHIPRSLAYSRSFALLGLGECQATRILATCAVMRGMRPTARGDVRTAVSANGRLLLCMIGLTRVERVESGQARTDDVSKTCRRHFACAHFITGDKGDEKRRTWCRHDHKRRHHIGSVPGGSHHSDLASREDIDKIAKEYRISPADLAAIRVFGPEKKRRDSPACSFLKVFLASMLTVSHARHRSSGSYGNAAR